MTVTPTATSFSVARNPVMRLWSCVPFRRFTKKFLKFSVPFAFASGTSFRNMLFFHAVANVPSFSTPSISPSQSKSRTLAYCTDARVSSATVGVPPPPPPDLPPPPEPWINFLFSLIVPTLPADQHQDRWIALPIQRKDAHRLLELANPVGLY